MSEKPGGRFHSLLFKIPVAQEVGEELDFHLAMRARELEARGVRPATAKLLARRRSRRSVCSGWCWPRSGSTA